MKKQSIYDASAGRTTGAYMSLLLLVCLGHTAHAADPRLTLNTPRPGATSITGKAQGLGAVVITHKHKHGGKHAQVAEVKANGTFEAAVSQPDELAAGDTVSVAAATEDKLPPLKAIHNGQPAVLEFSSALSQPLGSITVQITSQDPSYTAPEGLIGSHSGTVLQDPNNSAKAGTEIRLDDKDTFTLKSGVTVTAEDLKKLTVTAITAGDEAVTDSITEPLCEMGRLRCYAYFGGSFSGDFSKQDPYLDFNVETAWIKKRHLLLNVNFDARLTQIPTAPATATQASTTQANTTQASGAQANPPAPQDSGGAAKQTSTLDAFTTAAKSIQIQGGVNFAPFIPNHLVWNIKDGAFAGQYALIPALLFKGGGRGSVDGAVSVDKLAFPEQGKTFFTNYGGGFRLSFVKWHSEKGVAHETLSYVDLTFGKDRLYDFVGPDFGATANGGGASNARHYGLRKMMEARLKIPKIDVQVGCDLNVGQGQNEVRAVVTTNAVKILKSLFVPQ